MIDNLEPTHVDMINSMFSRSVNSLTAYLIIEDWLRAATPPGDKSSLKVIYYNKSKNTVTQLALRRICRDAASSVQ